MKQKLDEFDKKAKKFLEKKESQRIKDILKEYALYKAYEKGMELENPDRTLQRAGIQVENINDFTEFKLAKTLITEQIQKNKRKTGVDRFLGYME